MAICLECGVDDFHLVQLMTLPPHYLLLHKNPEWLTFLVPAYTGCPGKEAVKRVSVCLCICICLYIHSESKKGSHYNLAHNFSKS